MLPRDRELVALVAFEVAKDVAAQLYNQSLKDEQNEVGESEYDY